MTMICRQLAFLILTGLRGAGLEPSAMAVLAPVRSTDWWSFALNLGTEIIGAVVLFVLLDQAIGRRARHTEQLEVDRQRTAAEREADRRRIEGEKTGLVADMGSSDRDVAAAAVEKLSQREWLYDGTLCDAYLACANLREVDLAKAKLQRANLHRAELAGACLDVATLAEADLSFADLQGVEMGNANLTQADLSFAELAGANLGNANLARSDLSFCKLVGAHLESANLTRSNLSHADLTGANLRGARLHGADLGFAHLGEAQLDETTELPDGTNWTQFSDLFRFTYPKNAGFWRSDDPASPAYRGKGDG